MFVFTMEVNPSKRRRILTEEEKREREWLCKAKENGYVEFPQDKLAKIEQMMAKKHLKEALKEEKRQKKEEKKQEREREKERKREETKAKMYDCGEHGLLPLKEARRYWGAKGKESGEQGKDSGVKGKDYGYMGRKYKNVETKIFGPLGEESGCKGGRPRKDAPKPESPSPRNKGLVINQKRRARERISKAIADLKN